MIMAQLLVERGALRDRSEDWGEFEFLALPSPGDRVKVDREEQTNYLTVICVHHAPGAPGTGAASAQVVAKWTGSD